VCERKKNSKSKQTLIQGLAVFINDEKQIRHQFEKPYVKLRRRNKMPIL